MKTQAKFFEQLARAITSLGAVIFVMLMVITAMVFFSHTLFSQALPDGMSQWEKMGAAWALALGWELTVLVTTVNVKHLHPRTPLVMAVASGVISLYFIQAFNVDQPLLIITQRWFVGVLVATINYLYADLFFAKWNEYVAKLAEPAKLVDLESRVIHLQSRVNEAERERTELLSLRKLKASVETELTCPHCHTMQRTYGSLHAHKGHCSSNPKNKKTAHHV
ncbi:MAG: hypothetical protein ACKOE6_08520 [Flammeovirgaceae bacterium]